MVRFLHYGLLLALATTTLGSASVASEVGFVEEIGTSVGPALAEEAEGIAGGRYQGGKRSFIEKSQPELREILLVEGLRAQEKLGKQKRQATSSTTRSVVVVRTRPAPTSTSTTVSTTRLSTSSALATSSAATASTTRVSTTPSATSSSTPSSSPRTSSTVVSSIISSTISSTTPRTTTTSTISTTSTPPTSTAPVCAAKYTGAAMITGTGTLPKPTTFIQKNQAQLLSVNGAPFRMVGPNIYWLCQDENGQGPVGAPTTKERVREALAIAVAMGANTIRALSCGISVGNQYSIEPTLGQFGNWDIHDYVIYAAGQYGLRVIMTLVDNYDYYHGGKYTFLRWSGVSSANYGAAFYTNPTVVANFQNYVRELVGHFNPYTGRTWANDPTIAMWETGNELGGYIGREGYPPAQWTQGIINAIRSIDSQHLIMDGSGGFYNYSTKETSPSLQLAQIAVMSDHGYPRNVALLNSQIPLALNAQKGFFVGEYDWTDATGGDSLGSYLNAIESTNYLGDMIWNVMGHDSQCCKFVPHNEVYSMYYPNGNTPALQGNILQVVQHWYRMTNRPVPATLPGVTCPQPVF